jgi:hypothetical protein
VSVVGILKGPGSTIYSASSLAGNIRIWETQADHTLVLLDEVTVSLIPPPPSLSLTRYIAAPSTYGQHPRDDEGCRPRRYVPQDPRTTHRVLPRRSSKRPQVSRRSLEDVKRDLLRSVRPSPLRRSRGTNGE